MGLGNLARAEKAILDEGRFVLNWVYTCYLRSDKVYLSFTLQITNLLAS